MLIRPTRVRSATIAGAALFSILTASANPASGSSGAGTALAFGNLRRQV